MRCDDDVFITHSRSYTYIMKRYWIPFLEELLILFITLDLIKLKKTYLVLLIIRPKNYCILN